MFIFSVCYIVVTGPHTILLHKWRLRFFSLKIGEYTCFFFLPERGQEPPACLSNIDTAIWEYMVALSSRLFCLRNLCLARWFRNVWSCFVSFIFCKIITLLLEKQLEICPPDIPCMHDNESCNSLGFISESSICNFTRMTYFMWYKIVSSDLYLCYFVMRRLHTNDVAIGRRVSKWNLIRRVFPIGLRVYHCLLVPKIAYTNSFSFATSDHIDTYAIQPHFRPMPINLEASSFLLLAH